MIEPISVCWLFSSRILIRIINIANKGKFSVKFECANFARDAHEDMFIFLSPYPQVSLIPSLKNLSITYGTQSKPQNKVIKIK